MKRMYGAFGAALIAATATTSSAQPALPDNQLIQPSTFTVPGAFPTSVYASYYNDPTATSAQVQPVISDPVTHKTYPLSLTGPDSLPVNNTVDPHPLPPKASSSRLYAQALQQIKNIASNPTFDSTCAKCQASLEVAKFLALASPEEGPRLAVELCEFFGFSSTCGTTFSILGIGSVITQVVSNADVGGYDGQMLCQNFFSLCPLPPTSPLNLTSWFAKPKPNPLPAPRKPSGKRLKVLHVSDLHIDPRYATGSEANCTSGLCCREDHFNSASPNASLFPAPRFGTFRCDTPYALVMAAMQAIPPLTGTQDTGFAWTIYTGDMVSHDQDNQLSRDYIMWTETVVYDLFKRMLGSGPVYAALGNHDSYNQAQDAPHSLGPPLADQFSWNYDHVAALWKHEQWLPEAAVQMAKAHYSCYSVKRFDGFRVISLNTDFWYRANLFNYINMTDPDVSGMLRFLTDELQEAEDEGDRVWIIGHVLTGWDGSNPLMNPTNLFYQIVDRFSPHVIANIFFGHTHEDQMSIFYANNATNISAETAHALAWIGPSLTPITNLNSGFRVYEVDSNTFEVMDAHTWSSDVNTFPSLDAQVDVGPVYTYEYNTRETYGKTISGWGPSDPLNATWWHLVTEEMEADNSLVATFNHFQGKSSVKSPNCTGDCIPAKICYIRSGSSSIAKQNCRQGFGSVQSG
ncbi:ser thr protein phosphatase family protein [Moniliophthora roreri MCA 2997]|uniref:Sphingomyelin phosphodiesterase n=2 Tax=Moniliophthora roreri TaxID=221103 RepID=V2XH49_MONRO|nr:ser thr protein phosphatase family protein [Moniliophthora roreri MCA 2997]